MHVRRILEETITRRPVHLTLIDPPKQTAKRAEEIAAAADGLGTDGFLVGGSTGVEQANLTETVSAIKEVSNKPVIFFPGQSKVFSMSFDAVLFLTLLNSRNVDFLIRTQAQSALILKKLDVEILPTGYLVIEPGMSVGEMGESDLIERDNFWTASGYAVAAEMLGVKYIYLECGSGSPVTVPPDMVRAIKKVVDVPVIVGGGIRTAAVARQLILAGADIIITGTVVERHEYKQRLSEIIKAVTE
ncbi:MAG: geranylgeranylglyceryl/heptaprenylglyceryl phosphate synthase [Dethiobacter sp.]|jgi:phosphoglycerol geranylgeranyltransferase|nr:geranylgeranylglyceryl/heptaprenylglyceryl phosphate synthase [Dethiobacter sp.]